jgi:hypothetical protein
MNTSSVQHLTVLASVASALRSAAAYDRNDQVAPAAVLWPDEARQWESLIPKLREVMPELITLGDFDRTGTTKIGPAIWVKCMVSRGLPMANWTANATPVVYIPGFGRHHLKAIETCPPELKPLAELQYRGVYFTQVNGKDWTLRAFMQSADGGLGLDLASDAATLAAMQEALVELADVRVSDLSGRPIAAADFHQMLTPDPSRTMLEWMADPSAYKAQAGGRWSAFRTVCKDKFSFDPDKTDPVKAGQLLAERQGAWAGVWSRFEEHPAAYPGVKELLRRAKPVGTGSLFGGASFQTVYPQDNEAAEAELRADLIAVGKLHDAAARGRIADLEARHSPRRAIVWAKAGASPLAMALKHLAELAKLAEKPLGGVAHADVALLYAEVGWKVDAAALDALTCVRGQADFDAVGGAVAALYGPWLARSAEHFQSLVAKDPLPTAGAGEVLGIAPGECMLFADGLRMDVGQRLAAELAKRSLDPAIDWRWAPVPTVTATAKPAASPVSRQVSRTSSGGENFTPQVASNGKEWTQDRFRVLLKEAEIEVLSGADGKVGNAAWVEAGTLDARGHSEQARLAWFIADEVRLLADKIEALLAAGWASVKVVTDHGWLLLPGGLPKSTLPKYLTETRWGRCAEIKQGAIPEVQVHPWHWNREVMIAAAPGISCFKMGDAYAHGGLSPQECVVPTITVRRKGAVPVGGSARIVSMSWSNLRARVLVEGQSVHSVDVRLSAEDRTSSVLNEREPVVVGKDGSVRLYAHDDHDGVAAEVVALDEAGNVLTRIRTVVGEAGAA